MIIIREKFSKNLQKIYWEFIFNRRIYLKIMYLYLVNYILNKLTSIIN